MIETLLKLRTFVAYLGEKDQFNWWDTSFLGATGLKLLGINFPRSYLSAGINSAAEAAKAVHDSRIGRGRVFHLCRLPAELEANIHGLLLGYDHGQLLSLIKCKEETLLSLKNMCGSTLSAPEGPVRVGTSKKIGTEFGIEEMAKHYLDAFASGKKTFPYFSAE